MKRLFFLSRSNLSSAPYPELALSTLARAGWDITIVAHNASQSCYRKKLPFPCHTVDLPESRAQEESEVLRQLWSARLGDYDVLYINSQSAAVRAAIALAGPKLGKKIVYHNPDYYSPRDYPLQAAMEKRFCRRADLYINLEFHRAYITSVMYGITCPIITLPPNLPRTWNTPERSPQIREMMTGGRSDAFVLMQHGGYSTLRMTDQLLQALARLPERFRLVMTGKSRTPDAYDRKLLELGLTERVVRLPRLDYDELLSHSVNADAAVLLYANNDLGNFFQAPGRLTEYLVCDLPLVATNHTGLENLVLRYGLGEATDSTKPQAIADAITGLERRVASGEFGSGKIRNVFDEHLAFEHFEPSLLAAFDALMTEASVSARGPRFPWLPKP